MSVQERGRELRNRKRRELQARFPALRTLSTNPTPRLPPSPALKPLGKRIVIGRDVSGGVFVLPDASRFLHTHLIGVPGSGKSSGMSHQIRQDIYNGAAVVLLDPHGSHPESVLNKTARWLVASGLAAHRSVHLFDPSAPRTCGFNPLHCPKDTDPSVIAGNMVEAVERGWGDEDSQERPTMRRGLRALFIALAELGLTLLEAPLFLLPEDPFSARGWALQRLKDDRARAYFERLDRLAQNPRMSATFDVETVGILNRLEEFTSSAAIRRVFGQRDGMDLRKAMDEGAIILVNLAGGTEVYEKEGDLLGRLFLRSLLFNAKRRTNTRPCFVWMDEGHRFLSGDIPILFEEIRKYAVGITVAHQNLSQLGKPGDRIREAILAVPQNRFVFRLNSMAEATLLAPEVVTLNLEMPVSLLTKPTIVGHEIRLMRSESLGGGVTTTKSDSQTASAGKSRSTGGGTADTISNSRTNTTTKSESTGTSVGKSREQGTDTARHHSASRGTSRSVADGVADSTSVTRSSSTARSTTDTESVSESSGSASVSGGSHSDQSGWSQDRGSAIADTNTLDPASTEWPDRTQSTSNSRGRSGGESDTESWSESDSWSETTGSSHSESETQTEGLAETEGRTTSRVTTEGENESESHGISRGESESHGRNWAKTKTEGKSVGIGQTTGRSSGTSTTWMDGSTTSSGRTTGASTGISKSHSKGFAESLVPIMEDRASVVHGKENVMHMAAEVINHLPTGTAIVKALVGNRIEAAMVRLPYVNDPPELLAGVARAQLLEKTPSARPRANADEIIAERHEWLKAQGAKLIAPQSGVPDTPKTFRVSGERWANNPQRKEGKPPEESTK